MTMTHAPKTHKEEKTNVDTIRRNMSEKKTILFFLRNQD